MMTWFENTYFGGEAIPATYVNWGAMAMAAFYGSPPMFKKNTVWYPPVIEDWGQWRWAARPGQQSLVAADLQYHQASDPGIAGALLCGHAGGRQRGRRALAHARQRPALAGPDREPGAGRRRHPASSADTWVNFHEEMFQLTRAVNDNGDILPWLSLWAPGRHDQVACDFSTLLSPAMFREFFIPEIVAGCALVRIRHLPPGRAPGDEEPPQAAA